MSKPSYLLSASARQRLDEIYDYTLTRWGEEQAERYISDLFAFFARVTAGEVTPRTIPAEFEVEGFYGRCGRHYTYWRVLPDGCIGIVTILHERMHQMDQFRADLAP